MCALWNPLKLYVHAVVGVGATGPQIVLKPNPREAAPLCQNCCLIHQCHANIDGKYSSLSSARTGLSWKMFVIRPNS